MNELTLSLWRSAPLDARLRFAAELLPAEDPLQTALKEAIGIVQLWRRGPELEAWARAYPSLLVDTLNKLETHAPASDEAHQVCGALLMETRGVVNTTLRVLGFEWIVPRAGEPPPPDCRCEGDGPLVASNLRPGLRHRGILLLPAEVRLGASGPDPAAPTDGPEIRPIIRMAPISSDAPEWLRALRQAGDATNLGALEALAAGGLGDDAALIAAAEGLREALALEGCGVSLRAWLLEEAKVEVLEPREGDRFEPLTMQAVGERRTVHEHEADTVARLEGVGFAHEGRVLVPAEVVRYVGGDAW